MSPADLTDNADHFKSAKFAQSARNLLLFKFKNQNNF